MASPGSALWPSWSPAESGRWPIRRGRSRSGPGQGSAGRLAGRRRGGHAVASRLPQGSWRPRNTPAAISTMLAAMRSQLLARAAGHIDTTLASGCGRRRRRSGAAGFSSCFCCSSMAMKLARRAVRGTSGRAASRSAARARSWVSCSWQAGAAGQVRGHALGLGGGQAALGVGRQQGFQLVSRQKVRAFSWA